MIRRCEVAVARLEGSGAQALSFLKLLDEIKALMEYLEARGADLGPERTRMKTVEGLLRSKANVLVKEMKAVGGLARARQEVKPDESRWWWYLDRTVAERRRRRMLRWLAIGGAIVALLVAGVVAYRTFLAPSLEEQMLQQHLMQATQLRQEGDLTGALAEYEAARALAPVAGEYAGALFAIGLLGASTLAAAVLPISTAYAICEAFGWERGINRDFEEAPLFYGLYTGIIVIGAAAVLLPGIPLVPVMWLSQVANGVLLPVILILMIRLANNRRIMGNHVNGRLSNVVAWFTAVFVALATVALLVSGFF